jgi:thiamine biosynthesis lipoprotein ApbE
VLSDSAALSDGLSTAFFIMSYEDGLQLATELGVDVLWITTDGKMLKTEGMS